MNIAGQVLNRNVKLLKSRVSKHAVYGAVISGAALIIASLLSGYYTNGEISLEAFVDAQKTNIVLWFLDGMPFVFAFWGQYVSTVMAQEAGSLVVNQTEELRAHTEALESKATHDATHDSLTDLPNRGLFRDRLEQAIFYAQREGLKLAVYILDLDRFKEVNDTLGHYNGDRLLKQVASRLAGVKRHSDTLARLGGDEFAFLLPKIQEIDNIQIFAKKIQKALKTPFVLEKMTLDVQASIGIVSFPEHGQDVDTLIQRADVAMYVAKQDSASSFKVYSPKLDQYNPFRLTLMGELRVAIEQNDLVLHYQPKVESNSLDVVAVEALVRWQHANHGLIPPDEFIPLAERTGLIKDLTLWVLKKALRQIDDWHKKGLKIEMAVNVSSICLLDPEFPDTVTGLLASLDVAPKYLILEITETTLMSEPERSLEILFRLAKMGIQISIDDFGTGYSSLGYLKKMPATEIKIDKSFVLDMLESENDLAIVKATIQLAHNLGLKVVAEGVENRDICLKLKELECDVQQGFYISKPVPSARFFEWAQEKAKSPEKKSIQIPNIAAGAIARS